MSPRRVNIPTRTNLRERRRRRRNLVVGLAAGSALALIAAMIGATWLPFLRIKSVEITGAKTVESEKVEAFVQEGLKGTYALLVPKNDIFFYPRGALESSLKLQFPMFASVDVHAKNFHTLSVDVTERQPAALWCGETADPNASCFLIDDTGAVYAPAVVYSGDAYQRYFGRTSAGALPHQFLSPQEFHALFALVSSLQSGQNLIAQSISIDEVNDVRVAFENGFTLIFALDDDKSDVLNRFSLALHAQPFMEHQLADFEYLDLRFGNKLYYKLKGAQSAATSENIAKPQ